MIVTAEMNRYGHILVKPVNQKYKKTSLYLQADYDVESFIQYEVPRRKRRDLKEGWEVKFRISEAYFGECR